MHSLLENYLTELAVYLNALPPKRRDEELREMRAHLEAAFAHRRERGQTEDEAARDVLAQFGPPGTVGAETVTAWRRGVRLDRRDFWGAAAFTLALSFVVPRFLDRLAQHLGRPSFPDWTMPADVAWSLALVILLGGLNGFLFPRRGAAGMGLALLIVVAQSLSSFASWTSHPPLAMPLAVQISVAWLLYEKVFLFDLICVGAAWAVSRWRTRKGQGARLARG